ncbi:hypothetical protein [Aestuariirhabdus litorea]|uniref:Uncharacterized protein n=1 Tax=Aestuariirhabdus litorea TaxID=2528527 RepID=A0A3P3VR06_9GAMM|nr:hypothetical protein [Aestuariirhabdus litorea]RRJ85060.1 hypothetical protein D0544_08280 [Aestuariirhabdus litorea]RWW98285.1 hypothetical protein DZC74_08275 [Endozoicomonadaceae bacterium GTF-13]
MLSACSWGVTTHPELVGIEPLDSLVLLERSDDSVLLAEEKGLLQLSIYSAKGIGGLSIRRPQSDRWSRLELSLDLVALEYLRVATRDYEVRLSLPRRSDYPTPWEVRERLQDGAWSEWRSLSRQHPLSPWLESKGGWVKVKLSLQPVGEGDLRINWVDFYR